MTETMRAMRLHAPGQPLAIEDVPRPQAGRGEVQLRVLACGVCRTDLHVVDGELPDPCLPLIPGHEIVGEVTALGAGVTGLALGQRVGVPWLGGTCGECEPCRRGGADPLTPGSTLVRWAPPGQDALPGVAPWNRFPPPFRVSMRWRPRLPRDALIA